MYNNRFVVCLLIDGKPQRESKSGMVQLPFGTNYALRFRNKHPKRAVVKFFIDGEEASGNGYVVPANGFIDIERFANVAKKFKFVDLDSEDAIDYGKNGEQDGTKGLVEARFYLEKERVYPSQPLIPYDPPYNPWPYNPHDYPPFAPPPPPCVWTNNNINYLGLNSSGGTHCSSFSANAKSLYDPVNGCVRGVHANLGNTLDVEAFIGGITNDGVTVEGEYSSQNFGTTYLDYDMNNYTTVKLFLRGMAPEIAVARQQNLARAKLSEQNAQLEQLKKDLDIAKIQKQINDLQKQLNEVISS